MIERQQPFNFTIIIHKLNYRNCADWPFFDGTGEIEQIVNQDSGNLTNYKAPLTIIRQIKCSGINCYPPFPNCRSYVTF